MLRILGFDKQTNGVVLTVESDEFMPDDPDMDIVYLMAYGILETYMDHYGFPPGASLTALLLDAFYEDVDMPHWQSDFEEEFKQIVAMGPDRIEWRCDKDELLAAVTIDEDDPEQVAGTWVAVRNANAERAAAFERTAEERMADEFVSLMPTAQLAEPRDLTSPDMPADVGLGITFIP